MKKLETERLILRNWQDDDAEDLYEAAKNPNVGPMCGWNPHRDVEESLDTIRNILNGESCFALVLKETGRAIGSIELMGKDKSGLCGDCEAEMGFWLSEGYWGRGLMPEAAEKVLEYGFNELNLAKIWCAAKVSNFKSLRAQEKIGFRYIRTDKDVVSRFSGEIYDHVINSMTKEEWEENTKKQQ